MPVTVKGGVALTRETGRGGDAWLHGRESCLWHLTHSLMTDFSNLLPPQIKKVDLKVDKIVVTPTCLAHNC